MKKSYYNNRDYYPDMSRNSASSTKSMAQKRHHLSSSKVSQGKSKFENRIQKACPTNSVQTLKKQITLLKKELQRLQKENLKKDNKIFQMQSSYNVFKQLQSELEQTYRIIYMYEGKIQELQKQLRRLEAKIADNIETVFTAEEIQSLLNEYRDDNTEMRSTIEGQNRIIMELQEKLRSIQSKYFQTSWKLSTQNRVIANPLKKKFPKLRDTIVIQEMSLQDREKIFNDLDNKYQTINKQSQKQAQKIFRNDNSTKERFMTSNVQSRQIKDSRFTGVYQTPKSIRIQNRNIPKAQVFVSSKYKTQKFEKSPKTYEVSYQQGWTSSNKNSENANGNSYQFYRANESKKVQQSSQTQPVTYRYSSQVGNTYQNGQQNRLIVSHSGTNSPTRLVSNSKVLYTSNGASMQGPTVYRNYETNLNEYSRQSRQTSQSPSNRIIRVTPNEPQTFTSQNESQTYYRLSTNQQPGGIQETPSSKGKKTLFVRRPVSQQNKIITIN